MAKDPHNLLGGPFSCLNMRIQLTGSHLDEGKLGCHEKTVEQNKEDQQKHLAGSIPIYPGIGALSTRTTLSSDRIMGQVDMTRRLNAGGFTVFSLNPQTISSIIPDFKQSAGKVKAVPPHRLKK